MSESIFMLNFFPLDKKRKRRWELELMPQTPQSARRLSFPWQSDGIRLESTGVGMIGKWSQAREIRSASCWISNGDDMAIRCFSKVGGHSWINDPWLNKRLYNRPKFDLRRDNARTQGGSCPPTKFSGIRSPDRRLGNVSLRFSHFSNYS